MHKTLRRAAWMAAALGIVLAGASISGMPTEPDLTGRWAILQVTSQIGAIPLVGERVRSTSSRALLDVTHAGHEVVAVESACSTTIDNGTSLVRTVIPEAFLASMPVGSWTATLEPSATGILFERPWRTTVNGVVLDDPENDPLPTDASDPRVFDQDGDGNPGLTVRVSVAGLFQGEVYVVQRDRSRLSGAVVSADRVEGLVEWTSEQSVLGASNSFFLGGAASRPDPVAEHSYFVARRVADNFTCLDVAAAGDALFEP